MKKALQITKTVLVWIVVAIAVGMMIFTLISVSTFDKTDRNIFGFKFFIVTSDSMSATDFDAGDIAISKNIDPKTLNLMQATKWVQDSKGRNLLLFTAEYEIGWALDKNPGLVLKEFSQMWDEI